MTDASLSLNARAGAIADALAADAAALGAGVSRDGDGARLVDCGHRHPGGLEAGLRLARICLGGLAEVALVPSDPALAGAALPWSVLVRTSRPAEACLASQYAGWTFEGAEGRPLLGSGPARALARREAVFDDLAHREAASRAVLVLEGPDPPPPGTAAEVARACGVAAPRVTLLHAPTGSPAGMAQVAARVLECAVQKARALGFDLAALREAVGTAPLAPPHPDAQEAMGRANDAIVYGGLAHLFVAGPPDAARALAEALPSRTSPAWGRPFAALLAEAGGDLAAIDPALFAPARALVTSLRSGETFAAGAAEPARLRGVGGGLDGRGRDIEAPAR